MLFPGLQDFQDLLFPLEEDQEVGELGEPSVSSALTEDDVTEILAAEDRERQGDEYVDIFDDAVLNTL